MCVYVHQLFLCSLISSEPASRASSWKGGSCSESLLVGQCYGRITWGFIGTRKKYILFVCCLIDFIAYLLLLVGKS